MAEPMEDGAVALNEAPAQADTTTTAAPSAARTAIQAWTPSSPYLDDLRKADKNKAYETYLALRKTYGDAPGFFMDCADFFATELKNKLTAVSILSNLAELELENRQILMKTDRPPRLTLDPETGIVKVVGGREARKDVDYEEIQDIQFLEDMRDPKGTMLLDEPLDKDAIRGPESLGAKEAAEKAEEKNKNQKSLLEGF